MSEIEFKPLVTAATTTQSPNIQSVIDQLKEGIFKIPDYQRDSDQWDGPKKSLFIESIINGLTIPPLIIYPEDDKALGIEVMNIIDGQQRITTIDQFMKDGFALSPEDEVEYADNVSPIIQSKKYSELTMHVGESVIQI